MSGNYLPGRPAYVAMHAADETDRVTRALAAARQATETAAQAVAAVNAQPALEAGTAGWWRVWGATPAHIRAGDVVLTGGADTFYVSDTYRAKAHPVRVGIIVDGACSTLGALCPIAIMRRGTHNTLA